MAAEREEGEWLWEGVDEGFVGGARSRGEDDGWPREGESDGFVGGARSAQTAEVLAGVVVSDSVAAVVSQLAISFLGAGMS